jgi:DNA helicase-2/ATP-dependent DNA helicase PcrA
MVQEVKNMNPEVLDEAKEYLTTNQDGRLRLLVDIEYLANKLPPHRVIHTLNDLMELFKRRLKELTPEEFQVLYEGDRTMEKIGDIYVTYDREKIKKMLVDFDDLLFEVYRMLVANEESRSRVRETYRHILVDEFQDINPLQMEILKCMAEGRDNGSSFWVCGDDWQSIYAFNGATVGNILKFEETFKGSRTLILNMNYRSTPQILQACQNLISHNQRKIEKVLRTENPAGEEVVILEASSEEGEALSLVTEIDDLVGSRGFAHKDIAVLYRCNFQSRVIEEVFSQHKIPYHIENGLNFYNRPEVKTLLDYLRVIANPDSDEGDEALVHILNVPNRYIGRKFIQELKKFAADLDTHLYAGLRVMPVDIPYVRKNVKDFLAFMEPLIEDSEKMEPGELINLLRLALDYDRVVTEDDIPSPDDVKIQNIDQLQMAAAWFQDIRSFLEYTDQFEDEPASHDKDGVSLMTIHKAKGLEFPVVFIVGLVEGILPSRRGEIEEERRICFVGMSRAMQLLYLSYTRSYLGQPSKKSIFLDEIKDPE